MDEETKLAPKKRRRLDAPGRARRLDRMLERLRYGLSYDQIARQEKLTVVRVRQIIKEALAKRAVNEGGGGHAADHMGLLKPAMQLASDLIAGGEIKAIGPLLKVRERLDRYREAMNADRDVAYDRLADGINGIVALPAPTKARRAVKRAALAAEAARPDAPATGDEGSVSERDEAADEQNWFSP
jgi:hypothetical protein